jgi:hypothetical protein
LLNLAIRKFYKNVEAETYEFNIEFNLAQNNFGINIFRTMETKSSSINPRKQQQQQYYQNNTEEMAAKSKRKYRSGKDKQRNVPQGQAAPAPLLPPL